MLCGVEIGGMSVHAALAEAADPETIVARFSVDTTTPEETLGAVRAWIEGHAHNLRALGIAR